MPSMESLQQNFLESNWKSSEKIAYELTSLDLNDSVIFFIHCLSNEKSHIRNRAALSLKEIRDPRSVKPLIDGILDPIDKTKCATFVYSLESHDCSEHFVEIFKIMFYSNYECKISAHNILTEQEFMFSNADLISIQNMWQECKTNSDICPAFEDLQEAIDSDVESFICYLENE